MAFKRSGVRSPLSPHLFFFKARQTLFGGFLFVFALSEYHPWSCVFDQFGSKFGQTKVKDF